MSQYGTRQTVEVRHGKVIFLLTINVSLERTDWNNSFEKKKPDFFSALTGNL